MKDENGKQKKVAVKKTASKTTAASKSRKVATKKAATKSKSSAKSKRK